MVSTPSVTPAVYASNLIVMGNLPPRTLTTLDVVDTAEAFGAAYAGALVLALADHGVRVDPAALEFARACTV